MNRIGIFGITIGLIVGGYALLVQIGKSFQDSYGLLQSVSASADTLANAWGVFSRNYRAGVAEIEEQAFSITVTEVSGTYRVSKESILAAADLEQTTSSIGTSVAALEDAIEQLPWIAKANISTQISPARIQIAVTEEEPWLVAEYQGHSWLVSQNGVLLQTLSSIQNSSLVIEASELPRFTGLSATESAESYLRSSNARFEYGLKLLEFVDLAGGVPFEIEHYELLGDGSLRISAKDFGSAPEVFLKLSSLEEAKIALDRLSAVLKDLESKQERASSIDLRFKNQAVVR